MAANKFDIASQALVLVGGAPISDFEGGTTESLVASQLYEATILELVCSYRWVCMTRQDQLSRRASSPLNRWEAAYAVPPDCQVVRGVFVDDYPIKFDRFELDICCDALATDTVIMEHTYRADEAYWPGYFASVARYKLASVFAVPVAEDTNKAGYYEQKFLRQYASAKAVESQGRTAQKMPVGSLRRYHGGRP